MILTADKSGERADAALARLCPDLTRSAAQKLLESGAVTCGGKALKKNDKLTAGDILEDFVHRPDGFFSVVVSLGRFIQYVLSVVFHKTPRLCSWGYSITYRHDMQKRKVYP